MSKVSKKLEKQKQREQKTNNKMLYLNLNKSIIIFNVITHNNMI